MSNVRRKMKDHKYNKPSVWCKPVSGVQPSRLTGYRQKNGLTAVWLESKESSYFHDESGIEDKSYRHSEGQVLSNTSGRKTWFGVNHVESYPSQRRRQRYERLWRIDQGLDIDPSDRSLGIEAAHYADPNVCFESTTSDDIFVYRLADACVQQMELPPLVRNKVYSLTSRQDHRAFNRFGGLRGAIVGYCIRSLAEFQGCTTVMALKDSLWWSVVEEFAENIQITGATGRQFRQLTEYVDEQYNGDK